MNTSSFVLPLRRKGRDPFLHNETRIPFTGYAGNGCLNPIESQNLSVRFPTVGLPTSGSKGQDRFDPSQSLAIMLIALDAPSGMVENNGITEFFEASWLIEE